MISAEDCEFIKKFEVANSEEKQVILTNEGNQVRSPSPWCFKVIFTSSLKCCGTFPLFAHCEFDAISLF